MPETIKVHLRNYRQSPRKVRTVARLLLGKSAARALNDLRFVGKRAAEPIKKLLQSALANGQNLRLNSDSFFVKKFTVDGGPILYRRRFRARGRTNPIRKRTSHLTLVLSEKSKS